MIGIFYFKTNSRPSNIQCENITYLLDNKCRTNYALNGDKVHYDTKKKVIDTVINRCITPISGYIKISSIIVYGFNKKNVPKKMFISNNKHYPPFIVTTKESNKSTDIYAIIRPLRWNDSDKYPTGCIEKIIGEVSDYESEIEYLKTRNLINWSKWKFEIPDKDLTPNRIDLTNVVTFSIDPPGCKDIDDALHIKKLSNNQVEIGVHIADVSSYIPEDSDIDKQLQKRAQSAYLDKEQLNMLPDKLATNICSLTENSLKRVFSVFLIIECDFGKVVDVRFQKSLITNNKAMSYDKAAQIVKENYTGNTLVDKSVKFIYEIGRIIHYSKSKYRTHSYDTHKMIEIFMCLANTAVANVLYKNLPDDALLRICSSNKLESIESIDSLDPLYNTIKMANLIKLEAAEYKIGSTKGHIPLEEQFYTHFTSPIRRYYDIAVHRQLFSIISKTNDYYYILNDSQIDNLNYKAKMIKKAERESEVLELIYTLYYDNESSLNTTGYIIDISDAKVTLYLSSFKIILKSTIFSDKIKHTIDYLSENNVFSYKDIKLKLFDKINIQLIVSIKEPVFKNKLLVKILDPDFSL